MTDHATFERLHQRPRPQSGREARNESQKTYIAKDPEKHKAERKVNLWIDKATTRKYVFEKGVEEF